MNAYPVAILAGGLATRLRPLTETIPKAMLEVAGRPFIEHQLELLHKNGLRQVVICAGYLGEMLKEHVGDGSRFDMEVAWSFDGEKLLGTGGALRRALPLLGKAFFILYGDSYLRCPYIDIQKAFEDSGKLGLMTVFHNEGQYDTSNVEFAGGQIKVYDKKLRTPQMRHIDYGLGILRSVVLQGLDPDAPCDLAAVYGDLVHMGQLAGYEVTERFYEIGSHAGLGELDEIFRGEGA